MKYYARASRSANLAASEAAVPPGAVRGDRYPAALMQHLDSEKRK
jgi:hypothetical protein